MAFTVTAGGGTVSPATAVTNANGVAAAALTTGKTAGVNTVSAVAMNSENTALTYITPSSATFALRTFDAILPVAGNNQTGQILSALPVPPSVKVVDSLGKPRPGIPVKFTATSGGKVQVNVVSTGVDGIASPGTWTLGDTPGTQNLVAVVDYATLLLSATGTGTPIYYSPKFVSAGEFVTCAIETDSTVSCFGEEPKVGDGGTNNVSVPTPSKGGVTFQTLSAGVNNTVAHVCAVATDASVYCWGQQSYPDTTTGTKVVSSVIPAQYPTSITFTQASAGQLHNCALGSDQSIYCWGDNSSGQLGDPLAGTKRYSPGKVSGGFKFTAVTTGAGHSCGLAIDGSVYCWGNNSLGQFGNGNTSSSTSPTSAAPGLLFKQISAGDSFTCGITTTSKSYCWGNIGPTSAPITTPRAYTTAPDFASISSGGGHTCALTSDGTAYCWGDNSGAQLGDSTLTFRQNPVAVSTSVKFKAISAGFFHTCGSALSGAVLCWGKNVAGELGTDTTTHFYAQPRYIVLGVTPASGYKTPAFLKARK